MAQPQNNVSIVAPGFAGLNTQDSPLAMDQSFASVAENCVIDNFGRVASRSGFQAYTSNPEVLNGNPIVSTEEFLEDDGTAWLFATGDLQIFLQNKGTPDFALVPLTIDVGHPGITANNWKIVPFNEKCFFVQAGHVPLVFDPAVSTTALALWAEGLTEAGWPGNPNEAHAAFGRLWLGDFDDNKTIVFWSALLDGEDWTDSGTGSLLTAEYWPSGYDQITSLAAHNNFMVLFGKRNILLYETTADVQNSIRLVDTIEGIGCIARDSVVATGIDFMFIDSTGVRSLNRTIQEKSVPIGDISRNVRTEYQFALAQEATDDIKAVFHVEDSFYACFLPSNPKTYVFDTWAPSQDGAARATTWTGVTVRCGVRLDSRMTLFGGVGGLYEYTGSEDIVLDTANANAPVSTSIPMAYFTHPLDFGSAANLIFPKQVDVTLIGGLLGDLAIEWGFDYRAPDKLKKQTIGSGSLPSFWGAGTAAEPELGFAEWSDPELNPATIGVVGYWTEGQAIHQLKYNIWGSGRNVKIGFSADIQGSTISIQELNIQVLQGRIL